MFPSFISILDIQSWWEIPSIAHFCSLFRVAFNLLDFDIEDLEEALLSDGTEDNSWLQELIVRLLRGCLANNEISTINYQMFLRRLFRQKCQEDTNSYLKKNPFDNDIDFQSLPLRTKVEILQTLCDFRLDANDVLDHLKTFEADSLRIEPLGYDSNSSAYWYFYGTRLYREDYPLDKGSDFEKRQYKNLIKKKSIWQVVCFTEQDWENLTEKLRHTLNKSERQLYEILRDNFLPELPKLFEEKEKLHRKRVLERRIPLRSEQLVSKNNQFSNSESDSSNSPLSTSLRSLSPISSASLNPSDYDSDEKMSAKLTTKVGRQTNNSLAAATGNIFIHQPTDNSKRRKLKTSQVFVQSDEDLQIGMHKILECLKNHEDSWPFTDPVEEEYAPGYYSIIRKPMDLQKMEEKLDTGEYNSFTAFKADFQLIVDNCYLYNGSHNEYAEMVDSLQKAFKLATCRYLDNGSSDEEIAVEFPESKVVTPQQNINNGAMNRNNKSLRKIKKKSSSNKKKSKIQPRSRAQKKSTRITGSSRPGSAMDTDDVEDEEDEDDERDKEKVINNDDIEEDDDYETKKENIKDDSDNNKEIVDDNNDTKYIKKFEKWKHQKIKKNYKFNLMKVGRNSKLKASDKKLLETIEKLKAKNDFKQSERTNNNTVGDSSSHSENEKSTNYRQRASATATKRRKKVHKTKNEKRPKIESADNVTVTSTATRLRKRRTQRNSQIKNADDKAEFERNRKKRRKTTTTGSSQSVSSVSSRSTSRSSLNSFDDTINDRKKEKKTEKDLLPKDFKKRQMMLRDLSKVHKKPKMLSNRLHSTKKVNKTVNQPKPTAKLEDSNQNVLNKIRDMKHALNEKTSKVVDGGSKLSLGTVLDSFCPEDTKSPIEPVKSENKSDENIVDKPDTDKEDAEPEEEIIIIKKPCQEKATPNLSAWFKAFGGPKSSTSNATTVNSSSVLSSNLIVKKKVESDTIHSINSTATTTMPLIVTPKVEQQQPSLHPPLSTLPPPLVAQQQTLAAIVPHVVEKVISPQPSPIASDNLSPMPRPRRGSTGSSSSFSQDLDSPRVSVDERLANNSSYLVPFPSPLHKSPMAVSPSLPSPKSEDYSKQSQQQQQPQPQQQQQQLPPPPQIQQQLHHQQQQQQNQSQLQVNSQSQLAYNGNIRVGFYQDTTVSVKSSPEKCSSQEPTPNSSPYQSHYQDSMFNSGAVINHNHPDANSYQSSSPLFPFDNNFYQNNPPSSDNDKRITVSPDFTKKRSIDSTEFETKTDNSTGFLPKSSLNVQNGLYGNCIQPSIQCSTTTNNNDNSVDNVFNNRNQCNILESQHYSRSDLQTNTTDLSLKLNDNRLLKLGHLTNTSYPNSNSTDNNNGCNNLRIQDNGNCHRLNNITNLSHIVDRFSTNLNNHNHNHPSPYYTDNNLHHLTTSIYPATLSTPPIQDNGVKKARKTRKTKNGSTTVTTNVNDVNNSSTTHRPFMVDDSSAAKVAMTTNAFNFNPSPASLFPNDAAAAAAAAAAATYLDDFHTNYYIPPPNSAVSDKNVAAASGGAPPPPSFFSTNRTPPTNFAPHPSPFINPHGQATGALLDHNSPLYQQYLLHQGLLRGPPAPTSSTTHTTHGPHGYNAASYHAAAALSMRQPYDSIRPSWL